MIPMLKSLVAENAASDISRFVNIQMQRDINSRLLSVLEYFKRAEILLELLLKADKECNGQTFPTLLPQMSAFAHGIIDHLHIAVNITKSLRDISAYDLEYPSGKKISGPHSLKKLNPSLGSGLTEACKKLEEATKDLKGVRDSAHHIDERLNWKAGGKDIVSDEAMKIGCFVRGDVLRIESTAVVVNSPAATKKSIPSYLATVELSSASLQSFARKIGEVFAVLPWDGPLPEEIGP